MPADLLRDVHAGPTAMAILGPGKTRGRGGVSQADNERDKLIGLHNRRVESLMARICLDPSSRDLGGFIQPDTAHADTRNSIYDGFELFAAYLLPNWTEHYDSPRVWRALQLHLDFIRRRQRSDGTIDMGPTGVGLAPEIGFTLPGACAVYELARQSSLAGAPEIIATIEAYIRRGAEAVRQGFALTSNHRWTAIAGPLAHAHRLFPHPDNVAVIDDLLADGIDMDDAGVYLHERSPIYDTVANWGLLYLADAWGRQDLLELIERNLQFTLAMRQPNGEAETLFSHRQDRGEVGRRGGDYYVARRLAAHTGNAAFAWLAQQRLAEMERKGSGSCFIPLSLLLHDGRLSLDPVVARAPDDRVALWSQPAQLWRRRVRDVAATVSADAGGHYFELTQGTWGGLVRSDSIMSFHHGDAIIDAIKLRWGGGTGGFRPHRIEQLPDGGLRLEDHDFGWEHQSHFRRPGRDGMRHVPGDHRGELTVHWDSGQVRCQIKVDGWSQMPLNLQFLLREHGQLQHPNGRLTTLERHGRTFSDGQDLLLQVGDRWAIRISGLPASQHRMILPEQRIISGDAERRCHRLIVALFTPCDFTFTLEPQKL